MHVTLFTVGVTNITTTLDAQTDKAAILDVGDIILCIAQGRPEPTYKWYKENTSDVIEGPDLTVTDTMVRQQQSQ